MRILIAEDEPETGEAVRRRLEAAGHRVELVRTGAEARAVGATRPFDAVVLDRVLPSPDGMTVLRAWRDAGVATPVLMLTALGRVDDRVEGLDAGADDYLTKPFAPEELLARVAALGRRRQQADQPTSRDVCGIELDLLRRRARRAGREIRLKPLEFGILEQLMRNPGRVVSRTMLLEQVWGYGFDPGTNIVESHLSRLRAKLNEGGGRDPIETLRGVGYRMACP